MVHSHLEICELLIEHGGARIKVNEKKGTRLVDYLREGDAHSVEIINLLKSKGIINPKPERPAPAVQDLRELQVNQGEINNGGWCTIL